MPSRADNSITVPIHDFVCREVQHERELREAADTRISDLFLASVKTVDDARINQAATYDRRLHDLNGEAARERDILATTVTRELFETHRLNDSAWRDMVNKQLDETRGEARGAATRQTAVMGLIGLGVTVLSFIIHLLPAGVP